MTRFAGDFFGFALTPQSGGGSELINYFPELAQIGKAKKKTAFEQFEADQTRYNAPKTPEAFGSFRQFEKKKDAESASPSFGGMPSYTARY